MPTAGYANDSLSPEARLRQRLRIAYGRLTPTVQVAQVASYQLSIIN